MIIKRIKYYQLTNQNLVLALLNWYQN